MAWAKPTMFTFWSNSRLNLYEQCPLKAKLQDLDKAPSGPKSIHMERGIKFHTIAEEYVKGVGRTMPPELKRHADLFKELRKQFKKDPASMVVEDTWAFKKDWSGTHTKDWAECWLRVKVDCAQRVGNVVYIYDFKTGRFRPDDIEDYESQLELYALAGLLALSGIGKDLVIDPKLIYLDGGEIHPARERFTTKDIPRLKKAWEKRVKPMLTDKKFAPRPNKYCYSCWFRKDNSGPCKF